MLKLRELLNTLQTCDGRWEKSYESGRTPCWKKKIEGRLCPTTSPPGLGGSYYETDETLRNVVMTCHLANESWIFVNSVFPARRPTPISALTLVITVATAKRGQNNYQPNYYRMVQMILAGVGFSTWCIWPSCTARMFPCTLCWLLSCSAFQEFIKNVYASEMLGEVHTLRCVAVQQDAVLPSSFW